MLFFLNVFNEFSCVFCSAFILFWSFVNVILCRFFKSLKHQMKHKLLRFHRFPFEKQEFSLFSQKNFAKVSLKPSFSRIKSGWFHPKSLPKGLLPIKERVSRILNRSFPNSSFKLFRRRKSEEM